MLHHLYPASTTALSERAKALLSRSVRRSDLRLVFDETVATTAEVHVPALSPLLLGEMVDATISRVRMRDLARPGRYRPY